MPPKAVYDTNTIISGLLWRGKPYQCIHLARSGVVEACYCQEMLDELAEKLADKFAFSEDQIRQFMDDWKAKTTSVRITGTLHVVTDDPDDDMFLECAQIAGAKIIVSGDKHLKNIGKYRDIAILSASEFLEWLAGTADQ